MISLYPSHQDYNKETARHLLPTTVGAQIATVRKIKKTRLPMIRQAARNANITSAGHFRN